MATNRNNAIELLRIAATVLIVFHHYQQVTEVVFPNGVNFYGGQFYFGYVVEFFFLLSGYFMLHYVQRIKEGMSFKEFISRRVCRLLPMVAVTAIVYELLLGIYTEAMGRDWFGISVNLWGTIIDMLGVQAGWVFENPCVNNPTWYVSVLLLCYVIFYCLVALSRATKVDMRVLFFIMVIIGCGANGSGVDAPFLNQFTARGYYSFFFGLLLADALNSRTITGRHAACGVVTVALLTLVIWKRYAWVTSGIGYLMTFLYYPALLVVALWRSIQRFCNRIPAISAIGRCTYEVYLWHSPLLILMYILDASGLIAVVVASHKTMLVFTVACFLVAALAYRLLERPANAWLSARLAPKVSADSSEK